MQEDQSFEELKEGLLYNLKEYMNTVERTLQSNLQDAKARLNLTNAYSNLITSNTSFRSFIKEFTDNRLPVNKTNVDTSNPDI